MTVLSESSPSSNGGSVSLERWGISGVGSASSSSLVTPFDMLSDVLSALLSASTGWTLLAFFAERLAVTDSVLPLGDLAGDLTGDLADLLGDLAGETGVLACAPFFKVASWDLDKVLPKRFSSPDSRSLGCGLSENS